MPLRANGIMQPAVSGHWERHSLATFGEVLQKLAHTVDFRSASLYVMSPDSGCLRCVAEHGDGINFIEGVKFANGPGLSAWVAQKRRTIHLADIHRGSRHGHEPIRSYLAMPIYVDDEVAAVLNLGHVLPNAFSEKMPLLKAFGDQLAPALKSHLQKRHGFSGGDRRRN